MRASWKVDEVQRIVSRLSPERLASWRPLELRPRVGGPCAGVDVATGHVLAMEEDALLPGPLALRRAYCSGFAHRAGVLGRGWTLALEARIVREPAGLVLIDDDGRELLFEQDGDPASGLVLRHRLDPSVTLRCLGTGLYTIVDGEGRKRTFEASDARSPARLTSVELGVDAAWISHDELGRPVRVRSSGHELTLSYVGARLVRATLDLAGGERLDLARYDHDEHGDLARVRLPHGVERRYEHVGGLLVRRVAGDGSATYFGYDDVGSTAKCVRTWSDGGYDDRTLRYRRGATTVIDGTGAAQSFEHDALYRPLALPSGRVTYDAVTLGAVRFDGLEERCEAVLDEHGRPTAITQADGAVRRYEYDASGRAVACVDGSGARVEVRYGLDGRVSERIDDGVRVVVRSNDRGATELVVGDEWLELELDRARRPTRVTLRDEVWTASYDALGRPSTLRAPEGERRFEHDALGRLIALEIDGVRASFAHDGEGRLIRARTSEGDWSIERDEGGLPRTVARPDFACELDFDGREVRYLYAGSTRRISNVLLPGGHEVRVVRDAMGRVVRAEHGKLHVDRFAYDAAGRLVSAARDAREVVLTRDGRGAVIGERQGEDEIGVRRDARGRRALVVSSLGARIVRSWGPRGERVLEVIAPDGSSHRVELFGSTLRAGALEVTRAPDAPPVRGGGEGEVERDTLGRIAAWTGPDQRRFAYAYGPDGLLEEVTLPTGDPWRFEYDAFGRRVAARSARWDARWVWDGGVALHEITSYAPATLYVFDPADGAPVGKVQPGGVRWIGLYHDFICLFDPERPDVPTTEYWPWRGGLQIDFPTGLWLGAARAFHPRAAEPMGFGSLTDELFGPAERRPFEYRPRVAALLDRASDATLATFVHRLTTPASLELPRVPPAPWPSPIEPPRVVRVT
jgi:YD repeat-containing protein